MTFEYIIYRVESAIATIQINRPQCLNALNAAVTEELFAALRQVQEDPGVRVIIVTGTGKSFVAGADIQEMSDKGPRQARKFAELAVKVNDILESMPIPTIAAMNGYAFGGGMELALACDFRVGGPDTLLSFPEVGLGIVPGANGTARVTALVGPARAKTMIMLCKRLCGKDALSWGLLDVFAEDGKVYERAVDLAKALIRQPGCALAAAKKIINAAALQSVEDGKKLESGEFALLFDTKDQKEGMAAFMEHREPVYMGR